MRTRWTRGLALAAALGLAAPTAGCLAAAAAGAGAGIYFTSRGAESIVEGTVDDVAARTEAVFRELEITQTGSSTERSGDIREFKGTKGELEIRARIQRETGTTSKVEITAQRNLAQYDKDYAREILTRIVERG